MNLVEFLRTKNKQPRIKSIDLFCDIETYQYNQKAGYTQPSKFKNQVFSVAVAYITPDGDINIDHSYYDFKHFLLDIDNNLSKKLKVNLYFHNGKRYDNHYLLYNLLHDFNLERRQSYVRNVKPDKTAITPSKITTNMVIEKRVKSKTNLDIEFKLDNPKVHFKTVDTLPKVGNRSIASLGKTMLALGLIDADRLKTDFDYLKYNLNRDIPYQVSKEYARAIHENLSEKQLKYIDNDVYILASVYLNFERIFPGFDFHKITFSQNILSEYKINPLSNYQLTGKIEKNKETHYSDYDFQNENLFDYLKHFYKGGLNFYNDKYVGKIINRDINSYDLNSSYPNVMYNFPVPTTIKKALEFGHTEKIEYDKFIFTLYEVTIDDFNKLLNRLHSTLLKKLLVKYYSNMFEHVYINSNTIHLLNMFLGDDEKIKELNVLSSISFNCQYFGARKILAHNYAIKTQGKNKNKVDASDPSNIKILPEKNKRVFSKEEIMTSKVILNGIYGLPALRAHYNFFRYDYKQDKLISVPNGFDNTERNEIFSIFVTSQALYNLLQPLETLDGEEIDNYVYYGDTDSLYVDDAVDKKIDKKRFDNFNLGFFKKEHFIDKLYMLNHKKYVYHTPNEKQKLQIRSGGVPLSSFDLSEPFDDFVKHQFSHGVKLKTIRSYLTEIGTMAIYDANMVLEKGAQYPVQMSTFNSFMLRTIANSVKNDHNDNKQSVNEDILYIDSPFGAMSMQDIYRQKKPVTTNSITLLIQQQKFFDL